MFSTAFFFFCRISVIRVFNQIQLLKHDMKKVLFGLLGLLALPLMSQAQDVSSLIGDIQARQIGPAIMSGRISDIDAVNSNPNIIYVGAAGGGVWRSNNGGATFIPVFDEHIQSIGKVTVDQNNPDTVWVGTGEPWPRNSVSVGKGVYKTTNGGSSWTLMGLENTERISDIIVHPSSPNTVFVGALGHLWGPNQERGVYRTTDGGTNWEQVLFVDENTGVADLAMHPENPDVLYAAMWEFRRTAYSFSSGGTKSNLYKSTDGGSTWEVFRPKGLPKGKLGRIAIDIALSNPDVIYLSVEAEKEEDKGLYKSTDGGQSFALVNTDFNTKVRPFYFSRVKVAPSDENVVFKCGLNMIYSEDGGEVFSSVGGGVHADAHAVWIHPTNPEYSVIGTDGGAYRSLDGGKTYEMFNGLPISQFYQIAVDMQEPYNVYGGLQDNGCWMGPSQSPNGIESKDWELINWGDGFYALPHATEEHTIYAESQGGNIVRVDQRIRQGKDIKPYMQEGAPELRYNWNAPLITSAYAPDRLYFGAQFLFRSDDKGESWTKISPDLTTNDPARQNQKESGGLSTDNSAAENNTTIYSIAESPLDENLLWVGTDDGNLQVTTNGGKSWTNVAPNIEGLPAFAWCTRIEPGHYDKNTVYVTFDLHRANDMRPYVYKSTDLGKTWTSLASDQIEGYALSIAEDLVNPELLFLGTEMGLFISIDGGKNWGHFLNNMPKVGVRAMAIHPRDHSLVMGTHGRGVIIIDDLRPLRQLNADVLAQDFVVLENQPAWIGGMNFGGGNQGANQFAAGNPDETVSIMYYMKKRHVFGKMNLSVYDAGGKLIQELPAGKNAGLNIVPLNIRQPRPKAPPTNNRMSLFGNVFGPGLPEGDYKVVINKGKEEYETSFTIVAKPDSPFTAEERALQQKTVQTLYDMTQHMAYLYETSKGLETSARALAKDNAKYAKKLNAYADKLSTFQGDLVFLGGDFYVNEDERIAEKISQLYLTINLYPGPPSSSQLDRVGALQAEVEPVQASFDQLIGAELDKINAMLSKAGLSTLSITSKEDFLAAP